MESVSLFSKREDGGWVAGGSMGPSIESFCMQRNPYVFTSENITIERESEEEIVIDDVVGSEEGKTEKEEAVLGVTDTLVELPKTGNIDFSILVCGVLLLVVDLFLWYSVLRKKKYESNYSFTKLRTKK